MAKILVVDDEVNIRRMIRKFAEFEGYEVFEAVDGMDAVEKCESMSYDCIIMDIMMPEMDGFEFARTVRQVNRHIPILFMSARDDLPAKQKGFQLGIDDYMDGAEDHRGQPGAGRRRHDRGGGRGGDPRDHPGVQHPVQTALLSQPRLLPLPADG